MSNTINGRTPEVIKKGLECCTALYKCSVCPYNESDTGWECTVKRNKDVLQLIQQLEREREAAVDALLLKPLSWDEAMGDDAFLEIKGDEYIDAALNCLAFGQVDGTSKVGFVIYKTHDEDELKLLESEYGRTWRCWARRPTDEEREAAA